MKEQPAREAILVPRKQHFAKQLMNQLPPRSKRLNQISINQSSKTLATFANFLSRRSPNFWAKADAVSLENPF